MNLHNVLLTCGLSIGAITTILLTTSSTNSRHSNTEQPIMQPFSAIVPRFEKSYEIFGKTIDLSRYDLYERFDRELTGMCYTHSTTLLTIKRANRFFPIIIPILKDEGVPEDFVYLAAIESSFNQRALSSVKAAGIWQFMPDTGKRYGLEINDYVDERYHVEKATRAACKYLKEAYAKYGDWMSAAASYNAGQARITKQLEVQNAKTALDILLNEETSRYMFRIMALKEIMSNPFHYGYVIYSDQLYMPIKTKNVKVSTTIPDMTAWAEKHGCTYYQLKEFNPWLRAYSLPNKSGKTYHIAVPHQDDLYYNDHSFKVYNKNWVIDN